MLKRITLLLLLVFLVVNAMGCAQDDDDDSADDDDQTPIADDDTGENDDDDTPAVDDDTDEPYPPELPFSFVREDDSPPLTDEELTAFSEAMRDFYQDADYLNWLLRTSHGMDESTGLPPYRLRWSEIYGWKESDTVTFIHEYSDEHGGHNILKGNSDVLGGVIGGYLLTGDTLLGELSAQYCRGISSTMLGMVYDENDPIHHLMARNVVTSNHTYTTHDGRQKAVDYSNWYHPYDRWNCSRFNYVNNPYWGDVWVTNTRSKDGLGYLYKAAVSAYHASNHAPDEYVREACGETWSLLTLFAQDIVDTDYLIRSKDIDGNAYRPGVDPEPEEARIGDLASFTAWDILVPDAECNAKQASALLGYGSRLDNNCDAFGGSRIFEVLSFLNNPPNARIMRAFHMANIILALHNGDNEAALKSLGGLEERFARDLNVNLNWLDVNEDSWNMGIAVQWLQSATVGYYLTNDEIRTIHEYAYRAIEEYRQWPNWDLWADTVAAGEELDVIPSDNKTLEDETKLYWFPAQALGLFMEYCWGLYRNPASPPVIDCEIFAFGQ
ncbi:MAG TPA: hypothetical protein PKW95_03280 [bacterium]|nr:hypothetical protein [bacterium]